MGSWQDIEPLPVLLEERRYLLDVAYGLLGSRSAADDAVQETYAVWYAARGWDIWSPRVWLQKRLVSLCQSRAGLLDGTFLDDALGGGGRIDPLNQSTQGQDIDVVPGEAALQALEEAAKSLTPQERASFMAEAPIGQLHCAATHPARDPLPSELIAEMARQSLRSFNAGHVTAERRAAVVRELQIACETGDLRLMTSLLAPDVSVVFDGGGKIRVPDLPVSGAGNVTWCLGTFLTPTPGITVTEQGINGQPGLVVRSAGRVVAVISVDVHDDYVINAWLVLNPDKLRRWNES
ncbi:hypothetical protein AB0I54_44545 [Streptomyces sp. NPDC050625]|uniref:hypothetical protein n=1 Tax=Streptomyces sp. NPDC050625 TaxID=3154629 RepID=UPI00342EC67B